MITKLLQYLKRRRLRKAEEKLAYWENKRHVYKTICEKEHYTNDAHKLAECNGQCGKYTTRVRILKEELKSEGENNEETNL